MGGSESVGASLREKFKRRGEILAYFGELRILRNFVQQAIQVSIHLPNSNQVG